MTNPNRAKNDTLVNSWSCEAQECYDKGIMELDTFCHPMTGGLSLTLRKAAQHFKACADRMDWVERLKKNTLADFVREGTLREAKQEAEEQ